METKLLAMYMIPELLQYIMCNNVTKLNIRSSLQKYYSELREE